MKHLLTFALLVTCMGLMAQNKNQIAKTEYYVNEAAKAFNLDDVQKAKLYESRLKYNMDFSALAKDFKEGIIKEEEKKEKSKQLNNEANAVLADLTGKKMKELGEFNKRMREELKSLK